ncbi:MAG: hypothetical protein JRN54_06615 [Nitrososphaerota archaeon]|jgi:hypothetical protein|nr:hypothetical protein [Nitrososphaerota archaeon]
MGDAEMRRGGIRDHSRRRYQEGVVASVGMLDPVALLLAKAVNVFSEGELQKEPNLAKLC